MTENILNTANEDDFEITTTDNDETDKSETIQRSKEFAYYFVENLELNLNALLNILEDKNVQKPPNSTIINALSAASLAIPTIGKGVSSTLKESETYILGKIKKNKSRTLADLVFKFSDEKRVLRETLIEAALELFYVFEAQFMRLTCEGGARRAMQKLATDAANRIMSYFLLENNTINNDAQAIIKGVIFGQSTSGGKTVLNEKKLKWKTSKIYTKTGIILDSNNLYYYNEKTKPSIYGYRKIFTWENQDEIKETWILQHEPTFQQKYLLDREDLNHADILEYIMKKTPHEEAVLDRNIKHEESLEDRRKKHEEFVQNFNNKIQTLLDNIENAFKETTQKQDENKIILAEILDNQHNSNGSHTKINEKLTEIHQDVIVTKNNQLELCESSKKLEKTVEIIKNKQKHDEEQTIKINTKEIDIVVKTLAEKTAEVNEKIKKEIEREKLKKAVDSTKEALKKADPSRSLKKLFKR